MTTKQFRTLRIPVPLVVPATVAEFDANAKREGACLEEAINNVVYRGSLTGLRDLVIHGQEEEKDASGKVTQVAFKGWEAISGKERKTKKIKRGDKEVEVYDESEQDYVDRVVGVWEDAPPADFAAHVQAAAKLIPFDASAAERKPTGPKKLAEKYKTQALKFINATVNPATGKPYSLEKLQAAFKKDLNGKQYVPPVATPKDDPKNVEALGWICKEWEAAQDLTKGM